MTQIRQISGLKSQECDLLEAAGWGDLRSLAEAKVDFLHDEIVKANQVFRFIAKPPTRETVERWIQQAEKSLQKGVLDESPAKGRKSSVPAKPRTKKADVESLPVAEAPVETQPEHHGPVNFEALPEVQRMLADAPVAIPISPRMLSTRGIPPAEVKVAALLNSSTGDLQVRANSDALRKAALPSVKDARIMSAEIGVVKSVEPDAPVERVDIANMKLRSVEEFMGEGPGTRLSSLRNGMEDERIALLRSPRPETNRKAKPGTRRYIRGVLHDKPKRIFFGGMITVILQLLIPLSILAGPLLILQDQKVAAFRNVPVWLLAFPLSLPLFGILFLMVSSRAKCRVCGQRLYVPKHCLKNKKAHYLPYFGYIGSVGLHVMLFKWFNCPLCGTSNRIKE
jgi:Domain of unknown function (DUF4332)